MQNFSCTRHNCLIIAARSAALKPGLHVVVTVGDASPRQAWGHLGDGCVWKQFLNNISDVAVP